MDSSYDCYSIFLISLAGWHIKRRTPLTFYLLPFYLLAHLPRYLITPLPSYLFNLYPLFLPFRNFFDRSETKFGLRPLPSVDCSAI